MWRRDSNRGPCDRQSGDVSTRPQHLYNNTIDDDDDDDPQHLCSAIYLFQTFKGALTLILIFDFKFMYMPKLGTSIKSVSNYFIFTSLIT